ncbi:MAG: hypothetical protein B6U72_01570 [Candidatus Altiarchaeales archaeon ex4484_2]|nr:MAG: hypothetical protein B6U72_01570 [Candidatus Altiarchaeales archaeon ex4484_2]
MDYITRFRALMFGAFLSMTGLVYAQASGVDPGAASHFYNAMACIICQIMQFLYYIVAIIATLMVIVAGIKWITSSDDPEARNSAKSQVFNVVIGLIVVLLAAFLVSFIVVHAFLGGQGMVILDPVKMVIDGCDAICTTTIT